jgi:hypothetical protein
MDDAERVAAWQRLHQDPKRRELADRIESTTEAWLRHHWEQCDLPADAECDPCRDYVRIRQAAQARWEQDRRASLCVACAARHAIIGALAVEMLETLSTLIDEHHARMDDVAWCRLYNLVERRLHALRQETRP